MIKETNTRFSFDLTEEQLNQIKQKLACDLFMDASNEIYPDKWYKLRFTEESKKDEVFNTENYKLRMEMEEIPNEHYKFMTYEEICFQPKKKFFTRVKLAFKYILVNNKLVIKKRRRKMSRYEQRGANIFDSETNNERWDYVRLLNQQDEKIKKLKQQLAEKDKEIERLKRNYRIGKTNLQNKYDKLKNRLLKYPIQFDGCLIKNEKQLLEYANELVKDYEYMANLKNDYKENQNQKAIEELEKLINAIYTDNIEDGYLDESVDIYSLVNYINDRIKELKGENK